MANTRQEIDDRVVKLLNESSDSTTFDKDTRYALGNEVQAAVCKWDVVNLINEKVIKSPFLRFLAKRQFLKTVQPITAPDIDITDTEITVTTTFLQDDWYTYVNGDIIQYTAKTATQITWVTGIWTSQNAWEQMKQAYMLPSGAYKGFDLKMIKDWNETPIPFLDDRAPKDKPLYYTIVIDDSTSNEFMVIEWINEDGEVLIFDYYKSSTDMSDSDDTTDLPDDYGLQVIAPLVAWEFLYYTDEQAKGIGYLRQWYWKLNSMYMNFWERAKEFRKKVKTSSFDYSSVGGRGGGNYIPRKYR